jgi:hypothetical protein
MANVQFDQAFVMRGIRDRVAAALAVFQDEFEILSGEELQPFVGRQLQTSC